MKPILIALIFLPLFSLSQGIKFEEGITWDQVKAKAKAENKYIFIDAYTTWCAPCKMMDKYVYPNDTVGNFFNEKFISVKVQMDQTEKDGETIKNWYKDAGQIKRDFTVEAYPSLIFLSPDATILYKQEGYRPVQKLVDTAKLVLVNGTVYNDPYKQYRNLVEEYKKGIKHYDSLPYMIKTALKLSDADLARELLKDHINYASELNEQERYTKENIGIWSTFTLKQSSKALQYFLKDGDKIDQAMNQKGYSTGVVDKTIQSRIVDSFFRMQKGETTTIMGDKVSNSEIMFIGLPVRKDGKIVPDYVEADWKELERMIRKEFNKNYAKRNIFTARMRWYQQHQNMAGVSRMYFTKLDKYPPANLDFEIFMINYYSWRTFLYVTDKKLLNKATEWMGKTIQRKPGEDFRLDTYANLLYKLGRTNEAIQWEEKALNATNPADEGQKKAFRAVIEQMKRGEPTCLEQGAIWNN